MKDIDLKFHEYPLNVPTEKRTLNKLESLASEVEECGSILTAKNAIKHWNKYMNELGTDMGIISVLYSLDTRNPVYKRAQQKIDEISPLISSYATRVEKALVKARYRKDLEKKYGKYLLKMYEGNLRCFDEN